MLPFSWNWNLSWDFQEYICLVISIASVRKPVTYRYIYSLYKKRKIMTLRTIACSKVHGMELQYLPVLYLLHQQILWHVCTQCTMMVPSQFSSEPRNDFQIDSARWHWQSTNRRNCLETHAGTVLCDPSRRRSIFLDKVEKNRSLTLSWIQWTDRFSTPIQ